MLKQNRIIHHLKSVLLCKCNNLVGDKVKRNNGIIYISGLTVALLIGIVQSMLFSQQQGLPKAIHN